MKYTSIISTLALAALPAAALAQTDHAIVNPTEEAPEATVVPTTPAPIYTATDGEFGSSNLSDSQTLMQGKPADGRRLEEWTKQSKASVNFGGYIIGKYAWDSREAESVAQDGFNLRLVRLYVSGSVFRDFKYRLQLEVNGTPHIKDATLEWTHWKEFSIKAGQFKRAFTFENPYNPFDVGVGDYSQLVKKLAGFDDRVNGSTKYEKSTNGGRDLGIQFQGDLFPSRRDGHTFLHYQLAFYNGQGINTWDVDKKKDIIGTLQFSPVKNLTFGIFGWKGTVGVKEKVELAPGAGGTRTAIRTTDRKRLAAGVKYESDWTFRAEYARSWGYKLDDYAWDGVRNRYVLTTGGAAHGDKADAFYATLGIPCAPWLKAYLKYDLYREYANSERRNSIYSAALNFKFTKNLYFQAQYNLVDTVDDIVPTNEDRYSQLWAQMYVRF